MTPENCMTKKKNKMMPKGLRNSGFLMLIFNLANESLLMFVASSSFFSKSCFFTKLSNSSVASCEQPRSHKNASSASLMRCCVKSHDGDSGMSERMRKIRMGKIPATNATIFQWRNVPRTWHSKMPKEIESVMDASRNPRYFGSLQMRGNEKLMNRYEKK